MGEYKNYESPRVFRWVEEESYPLRVKKCWNCGNDLFVQKDNHSPFICTKCGKEN